MKEPKYVTDYGVLMERFLMVMVQDTELQHKSFIKKIQNKMDRYHKRRQQMCSVSESRVVRAITQAEKVMTELPQTISIGAIIWLIHNRHKEVLKPYDFNKESFEQLNKFCNAQGVIMSTAKVLNVIEEHMYE